MQDLIKCLIVLTTITSLQQLSGEDLQVSTPPQNYFVGSWLGDVPGGVFLYRLELYTNGTGVLGRLYHTNVVLYGISHWSFKDRKLDMQLAAPASNEAVLRVQWKGAQIGLQVEGKGWRNVATLSREDDFKKRLELLKNGMSYRLSTNK
jgi:hypothetical protein